MSSSHSAQERSLSSKPGKDGRPQFDWELTPSALTDVVKLVVRTEVLPVIFVPGIMGSNLRLKSDGQIVWRLDAGVGGKPTTLVWMMSGTSAGKRQSLLHPARTEVDRDGAIPKNVRGLDDKALKARGWGTVGQTSYGEFLKWLEETLNPQEINPALWPEFLQAGTALSSRLGADGKLTLIPGRRVGMQGQPFGEDEAFEPLMTDDLLRRSKFWMPVHAVGYNWLASNQEAAKKVLAPAINSIRSQYNASPFTCRQVILVTHSMGGLVARACAQLPDMQDQIAGIVHGVMPATGAAVAYRRCKIGLASEGAGVEGFLGAEVIGQSGKEVTAVFAQAPGALQLLPSKDYQPGWLSVYQGTGAAQTWPRSNPYKEIYKVRDKWWGLVHEDWLSPKEGVPIEWKDFVENVDEAESFHDDISGNYHPQTYVFYGADDKQPSFERVSWQARPGRGRHATQVPDMPALLQMSPQRMKLEGLTPEYVPGSAERLSAATPRAANSFDFWELHGAHHDGIGDGTVPVSSGRAPRERGGKNIKQQFALQGFSHEPAFNNAIARHATLYAITKIAGTAKIGTTAGTTRKAIP